MAPSATEQPLFGIWDADDADDRSQWVAHWRCWPEREVAAHPNYALLFAARPHERALAAYWKSADACVLYPFILRDLSVESCYCPSLGRCSDIASPYGYGGPFCWGTNAVAVASDFWRRFDQWARDQAIVSEFVRLSLFPEAQLPYPGARVPKLTNVVCDLAGEEATLAHRMKPKVRRNIKKAEREGVTVIRDDCGDTAREFQRLYTATMQRRGADSRYYFSASFFEQLHAGLPGQFAYFHALRRGTVISTELVLISAQNVYFFLGGSDESYYALRPNELLKFQVMLWARELGKRNYVLGGGHAEGDGIFQYKQAFAPDGLLPFCVGQRILVPEVYSQLMARCRHPVAPERRNFFPSYRAA